MKYMHRIIYVVLVAMAFLTSCRSDIVYSRFFPIPSGEWCMDSVAEFDFPIEDTVTGYRMLVYVRHTERYPYQNMWLFIGGSLYSDTIEFYLADDRGKWLGEKHNGFIEMPVLIEDDYHFHRAGDYRMEIRHGMRDSLLRGITDIGLEIRNND